LIFQWAGRRKSERSDLRRRSEHAPINSRPATTLLCSKSEAGSIYCLSPPPKVRTERNLQNSRLNPDETSSLVDLERRIPAQCAFFTQLMRESRRPEDSLAEREGFELAGDYGTEFTSGAVLHWATGRSDLVCSWLPFWHAGSGAPAVS